MYKLNILQDYDLAHKKVILRVDFNVPFKSGKILDNTRIIKILPTIKYLIKHNAKVIILSHLGRPQGKFNEQLSQKFIALELEHLLAKKVKFAATVTGNETIELVEKLKDGEILMLENLRFYPQEEQNDLTFAKQLASYGDVYINDAFSCCHRSHASITALAELLPSAAGLLLQQEIESLHYYMSDQQNMMAIIGGSKISTKLNLLNSLLTKTKILVIAGAMANSFLKAQNYDIGKSMFEPDLIDAANNILAKASELGCKIILPIDVTVTTNLNDCNHQMKLVSEIAKDDIIVDLGPKTIASILQSLTACKKIIWNGPLGIIEIKPFDQATIQIAKFIAERTNSQQLVSIAGGGDIVSALNANKLTEYFSYISTAGGAFLEWLEGQSLPGLTVLYR